MFKMSSTQPPDPETSSPQQQLSEDAVRQALTSLAATNPNFLRNLLQVAMQQDDADTREIDPAAQLAFRIQRPNLLSAINCTLQVTNFLYSKGVVSEAVRNKISPDVVGQPKVDKNMILLNAVEDKIKIDPQAFHIFIEALQSEPSLEKMTTMLLQSYRQQKTASITVGGTPSSLASPIHRYAIYLRAYYSTSPISQDYKWPPTPSTKYINLAVVKKDKVTRASADAFTRTTLRIHGDVDQILRAKLPIAMEDVLKPEGSKKLRFVLVEGAPGVGKSTFAWEFCQRWDEIETLRQFSLVVLLRLRDEGIQKATSLADFFPHIDSHLSQAVVQEVVANEGAGVLFVMDGADELPANIRGNAKSLFFQVASGSWLPKATVLITSRPSVTLDLALKMKPDKHVEIVGFTKAQIKKYAKSVFQSDNESNPGLLAGFLKYISSTPSILGMLYIPLNTAIAVEVYRENVAKHTTIPTTLTQLYTEFSCTLLQRCLLQKQYVEDPCDLPQTIEELPQEVHENLLALAKVAFKGILTQTLVFSRLSRDSSTLGFTTTCAELHTGRKVSYNFLHLTLQEYLAALYFSKLTPEEQRTIFQKIEYRDTHMDIVWRFVGGLTGFSGIGWELVRSHRNVPAGSVDLFILQCLYETQDCALYESVLGTGECELSVVKYILTPLDFFILGCSIASSRCLWSVKVYGQCHLGRELGEMLVLGTQHVLGSIDELGSVRPQGEGVGNLKKLAMVMFGLDDAAISILARDLIPFASHLEHLEVSFNPISMAGVEELLQSLLRTKQKTRMKHLSLLVKNLSLVNIHTLSELISPSTGILESLSIGMERPGRETIKMKPLECYSTHLPADMKEMINATLQNTSLQGLVLLSCDLRFSMSTLAALLEQNSNIRRFYLFDCTIAGSVGAWMLALALCRNVTLKECTVFPGFEDIGSKGATAFLMVLLVNRSLKRLKLTGTLGMGVNDISSLIDSLKYNHSLEELTLDHRFKNYFPQTIIDPRVTWSETIMDPVVTVMERSPAP